MRRLPSPTPPTPLGALTPRDAAAEALGPRLVDVVGAEDGLELAALADGHGAPAVQQQPRHDDVVARPHGVHEVILQDDDDAARRGADVERLASGGGERG